MNSPQRDGLAAAVGLSDHAKIGGRREGVRDRLAEHRMVVDDQQTDHAGYGHPTTMQYQAAVCHFLNR